MAKVKYDPLVEEITNKHYGFTFQRNHYGNSMQPASRSSRTRYASQFQRMQNLQKAVRFWRDMAPATKAAWNTFAATYPQPTKKDPANFLSGYQLFLKRNHYLFLNTGIDTPFMELPTMETLPFSNPTFEIKEGNNCLDMTELYIQNFGCIPSPGQFVLFMAVPMSETSGQFFTPITNLLSVEAVYIDGFFINVILPAGVRNITFSVYLSKPVSSGVAYAGTKVRFMGCFSSKTFLELTDTPASYAGQQNKVVAVKADQTGLEFITPSSGGLTCADLVNCPKIISIDLLIAQLTYSVTKPVPPIWLASSLTVLYKSSDGITFTSMGAYSLGFQEGEIIYVNKYKLFLNAGAPMTWSSNYGTSWSAGIVTAGTNWRKFSFNSSGLIIAVGTGSVNVLAKSTDGKNWTVMGKAILPGGAMAVICHNDMFIIGGFTDYSTNTMAYSLDGLNWIGLGRTIFTVECVDITYGNGRFVACGRGTYDTAWSLNGINWNGVNAGFGTKCEHVAFGNGIFCAVGYNGLKSSYDGITWFYPEASSNTWGNGILCSLKFDGTKFVLSSSVQKYSLDGLSWLPISGLLISQCMGTTYDIDCQNF